MIAVFSAESEPLKLPAWREEAQMYPSWQWMGAGEEESLNFGSVVVRGQFW